MDKPPRGEFYSPCLSGRAKELRTAGNLSEALLWKQLQSKRLNGIKFNRQTVIGKYIVDFVSRAKSVIIEIDGESHNEKADYDERRETFLIGLGFKVIHIDDKDIKNNLEGVIEYLKNHPTLT